MSDLNLIDEEEGMTLLEDDVDASFCSVDGIISISSDEDELASSSRDGRGYSEEERSSSSSAGADRGTTCFSSLMVD